MNEKKFDVKKLQKLNNPARLKDIPPQSIVARLDGATPAVMIEIGAGTGFFSIALAELLKPVTLYACDISPTMVDWMTENVVFAHPEIIPIQSGETGIPLPDGIADLLFMINLHHELDDPVQTIAESCRLLRTGGTLVVIDWKKQEMNDGPPQRMRYQAETVAEQLLAGGFARITPHDDLPKHFMVVARKGK
ncbi:MAG: class I SAM-dependent methyltransferase [Desulfopila sp.]